MVFGSVGALCSWCNLAGWQKRPQGFTGLLQQLCNQQLCNQQLCNPASTSAANSGCGVST